MFLGMEDVSYFTDVWYYHVTLHYFQAFPNFGFYFAGYTFGTFGYLYVWLELQMNKENICRFLQGKGA